MTDVSGRRASRRDVLRSVGAVGIVSIAGLTGTAVAEQKRDRTYGNGNGIGAFLNEKAALKETPIFTGKILDYRGESTVEVENGITTEIIPTDIDLGPPFGVVTVEEAPVAYDKIAIRVSVGTTVEWVWSDDLLSLVPEVVEFPIPHNVVAVADKSGTVAFDSGAPVYAPTTFSHTFTEPGTYLYYCTPHGAPFPVPFDGELVYNEFGMRGAVLVSPN